MNYLLFSIAKILVRVFKRLEVKTKLYILLDIRLFVVFDNRIGIGLPCQKRLENRLFAVSLEGEVSKEVDKGGGTAGVVKRVIKVTV